MPISAALDDNDSMDFNMLIVDDEPEIADLFRRRFRREVRQGRYVLHFAASCDDARERRADELGAAAFPAKPVDFDRLEQQLIQLIPDPPSG